MKRREGDEKPLPEWVATVLAVLFVATSFVGGAVFLVGRWIIHLWMPR